VFRVHNLSFCVLIQKWLEINVMVASWIGEELPSNQPWSKVGSLLSNGMSIGQKYNRVYFRKDIILNKLFLGYIIVIQSYSIQEINI